MVQRKQNSPRLRSGRTRSKSFISFIKKYYFILIIIGCVGFVGIVSTYKLYIQKPTYVYVKIRVGQGYWWSSTARPSLWYIRAIREAKEEKDLVGNTVAKILRVSYYPYYGSSQFETFVTLQLKVSKVGHKGTYNFKRETIGVSGPIDLEFSNVQISGTIIALSDKPIVSRLTERTVYLTKKYAYPWEYDEIKIGDYLNDGNGIVVEILDKAKGDTNEVFVNEQGKLVNSESETYRYISLKVKLRGREEVGRFIYGEETIVTPGRGIGFITNGFVFNDYYVARVE